MTIAPGRLLGDELVSLGEGDADLGGRNDLHEDLVVLEIGARRVSPRVPPALLLAETQLATDAVVDVLRGGLRHLRGEAVDAEHVVVRAVDLQAVGQLRRAGPGGDHLERDDVALAVRRVLRGTDVVGEAEPVLLGLAREREPPQLGVDVARVVHDHRVAVGERRPVAVHGLERSQPSRTASSIERCRRGSSSVRSSSSHLAGSRTPRNCQLIL